MLKKSLTLLAFIFCWGLTASAQSTMTDEQVLEYVQSGLAAGKSQKAMMNELVLKGVDRAQAERVKRLYESRKNGQSRTIAEVGTTRSHAMSNPSETAAEDDPLVTENSIDEKEIEDASSQIFGRNIFRNKNLNFAPSENLATPRNYRLGPGDEVIIDIFGANQTTLRSTISPEGSINVDVLGPLYLSGMTIEEANSYLKKRLAGIYAGLNNSGARSDIRLSLGQIRSIQINILGDVEYPGTYTLSSFSTVFHALYKAGGIKDPGSLRNIKVNRNGRTIATVDVYEFLMNGNRSGDIRLDEGDVILVPPYTTLVSIKGKVKRPMRFELKEGENLKKLLNYAGGFAQSAYTNSVTIIRQTGKEYEVKTVDDMEFASFEMKDGDEVEVGELLSRFENRIKIEGAVYRAGLYQLSGELNTVSKLIKKADGLLPEAFTKRAVLHRERPDRSLEVLSVDVEGILAGTRPDVVLRNNDVLFIPSIYDLKDQGILTISGEVASPGIFPYAANTTLEDLVLQAGGLLESASSARVDVTRRIKDSYAMKADKHLSEVFSFALKDGFVIEGEPGFVLEPYDEVIVRKSPSYHSQMNVYVSGESNFTGQFPLTEKEERLTDLLKKAGGLTDFAYVKGARLVRRINQEERRRMESVMTALKQSSDSINASQLDFGDVYYVGINLDKAIEQPGSHYDIVLREGDHLEIPQYNSTVRISGAVISPNTVTYMPKMTAKEYINEAGGYAENAKKRKAYVIHMNGHISRVKRSTTIDPGSEIIVPTREKSKWNLQNTLSIATTSASLATMIASIANILK